MNLKEFKKIFTTDCNIDHISACAVVGSTCNKYSCLLNPRRSDGIILSGEFPSVYEYDNGQRFYSKPGDILFLPKGSRYTKTIQNYGSAKTSTHYLINFRITDNSGEPINLSSEILKLSSYDETYKHTFISIEKCYRNGDVMGLKSRLFKLLGDLMPSDADNECCITYIKNHYTHNFSIPELARRCAMSETTYRKRFKEITGLSPVQYINRLKIEKACEMLSSGEFSPAYISDFLSFYSASYFYKIFKDVTGTTPNEYKKNSGAIL